jgi:hypothetical protein
MASPLIPDGDMLCFAGPREVPSRAVVTQARLISHDSSSQGLQGYGKENNLRH